MEERIRFPNSTQPIDVSFDHFYSKQPEYIRTIEVDEERDPKIESSFLDYKFLRLKENEVLADCDGLGQYVRNRSLQEGLVIIVGHPGGNEMREKTCVVLSNLSWREQLEQRHISTIRLRAYRYEKKRSLAYDTTLFYG